MTEKWAEYVLLKLNNINQKNETHLKKIRNNEMLNPSNETPWWQMEKWRAKIQKYQPRNTMQKFYSNKIRLILKLKKKKKTGSD